MCLVNTFIQVHTDWQKYLQYFNAHLWAPTLTPKYIPCGISVRWPPDFRTDPAFVAHRSAYRFTHSVRPNRSVPTDPVLGLHSGSGRCWAFLSTLPLCIGAIVFMVHCGGKPPWGHNSKSRVRKGARNFGTYMMCSAHNPVYPWTSYIVIFLWP